MNQQIQPIKEKVFRQIEIYPADASRMLDIFLFVGKIKAGFPSPADDFVTAAIDLIMGNVFKKHLWNGYPQSIKAPVSITQINNSIGNTRSRKNGSQPKYLFLGCSHVAAI